MKKISIILNFILSATLLASEKLVNVRISPQGDIQCHPCNKNLALHFTFPVVNNNNNQSIAMQNQEQVIQQLPKSTLETVWPHLDEYRQLFSEQTDCFYQLFSMKNMFYATCISTCVFYAFFAFKLKNIQAMLEDPQAWCNWKGEISPEKFFGQKDSELSEELINSIQNSYCDFKHPTDTTKPLQQFLREYKRELLLCKSYFTIMKILSYLRCTRFFKINKEAMDLKIKDRIERLAFIRTLFFKWVTEHRTFHYEVSAA